MVFALVAEVLQSKSRDVEVRDLVSSEKFTIDIEEYEDLTVGETVLLVGKKVGLLYSATKVVIRKILDPLYEEDLFEKAGEFTLIKVVNDPFPLNWEKFKPEGL